MIRFYKPLLVGGVALAVSLIALLAILDQRRSLIKGSHNQIGAVRIQNPSRVTRTPRDRQVIAQQQIAREEQARQEIAREQFARQEQARQQLAREQLAREQLARQQLARQQVARRGIARQRFARQDLAPDSGGSAFTPIRSLYTLNNRACEDDDLSSFILQVDLIKKDRRLAWQQHDIDDCNAMVLSYVKRGVRENGNYYLRRKLVETFGQTNHTELINRLRLVAVLLGGERGTGGMDPVFTPIREEAHRISPYVLVLIENYITQLEKKMTRAGIDRNVDINFKQFVDSLGNSFQSEYGIADIGARNRNQPAKELYALKVLLRDVREYYGERVEGRSDAQRYEVIFSHPGTFTSDTLTDLNRRHASMRPNELADRFIQLGLELREHLGQLRDQAAEQGTSRWRHDDEEIAHLKKLNEIAATVTGLFGASRRDKDPIAQALTLVDILFLEGLYSKKDRKSLLKELDVRPELGSGHPKETRAFYTFLNYMNGLAYAKLDEALGDAARAYSKITPEAENYMEVQARKSSLQVLGQLQQEFFQKHRSILAGKKDIHIAGTARGRLKVFRSESEIATFLRQDALNGADTIWVMKSGLNMPNEASFAAIILEDPIRKASHYDGYARSKSPPIPLLQIPGAAASYAKFDGKNVRLEASRSPSEKVEIKNASAVEARATLPANRRTRLPQAKGRPQLIEIDKPKNDAEIHEMQKQAGSKAANYAFLRSTLPLDKSKNEEHIYPGFAIPFYYYEQHLANSGVEPVINNLKSIKDPKSVSDYLAAIRNQILNAPVEDALLDLFHNQLEDRLRSQHADQAEIIKLRFRSSSNAEDNNDFSGAGLYESHFAFYSYVNGSSAVRDAHSENRINVATAIKKVWASLWKAEAYQARERAGIEQETVRMGILVHPSYRKEESTGVVFYYAPNDIEIAVNKGNANVQNPSIAGLTPEMHRITDGPHRIEYSSRFILTEDVILSSSDREQLMELLDGVIPKFRKLYPDQEVSGVDIEFKVLEVPDTEGGEKDVVMLKQIRPLAKRVGTKSN